MEYLKVRTTLDEKDWYAYLAAASTRLVNAKRADATWLVRMAPTAMMFALIAVFVIMLLLKPPLMQPEGLLLLIAAFVAIAGLRRWIQKRVSAPMKDGAFLGSVEFEIGARGFKARRSNSETFNQWSIVNDVTHTSDHLFVWIDAFTAYVLPVRDLPAGMTPPAGAILLLEFKAAAASMPLESTVALASPELSEISATSEWVRPRPPLRPTVVQELRALGRLHTWGLVDGARLFGRDATILLLGILSFALWAGLDRLNYEGGVYLFVYGIAENAALVLGLLFIAWVISRLSRPRVELRRGLLLTLGFLPMFIGAMWFTGILPRIGTITIAVLIAAWGDRYLRAGLRSMTGTTQNLAVPAALVGTVLLIYLSSQVYYAPGIWMERDADPEEAAATQRDNEQLVFEQSARLNAAIENLAPRIAEKANAFFVGFAGYGGQRVFAEEIGLASKRIGERYGATQRSLLLINDRRNFEKQPLATATALRHALNTLAKRMNVDEDVLFLSLSSHGGEDATISVSSELGYWRDLGANDLAEMLKESGIRWKVIVISACHAGSFINALRDENTIILTAAAADRTSFGCSDDNDLTYFGEAFYRDALPKAATLRDAFETARVELERREKAEGRTPSAPQAHFGAALEKKLAEIEAARSAH
jgi:Peptidase C13 family